MQERLFFLCLWWQGKLIDIRGRIRGIFGESLAHAAYPYDSKPWSRSVWSNNPLFTTYLWIEYDASYNHPWLHYMKNKNIENRNGNLDYIGFTYDDNDQVSQFRCLIQATNSQWPMITSMTKRGPFSVLGDRSGSDARESLRYDSLGRGAIKTIGDIKNFGYDKQGNIVNLESCWRLW